MVMKVTPSTTINELIDAYPFLLDYLIAYNPKFSVLKNSIMRTALGPKAKLSLVANMGGIQLETFMSDIESEIVKHTGAPAETDVNDTDKGYDDDKLNRLKEIIRSLHRGEAFDAVKAEFDTLMSEIDPTKIAEMEEQLIREGMPAQEIQRLCDLHVSMFSDILDTHDEVEALPGHPVHTYMEENKRITEIVGRVDTAVGALTQSAGNDGVFQQLNALLDELSNITVHYTRKENQLFPYLEKHDVTGPSQVMWGIHDEIRGMLKQLKAAVTDSDSDTTIETAPKLSRAIVEMIYKENTILFPMAMDKLSDEEWLDILNGEKEIGYAYTAPGTDWPVGEHAAATDNTTQDDDSAQSDNLLSLDTGILALDQINTMLASLPLDISFVDENDVVRYYSNTAERIFPRSPGIIGRTVQNCHPPKSVDIVNRILTAFKSGERDQANFRITVDGRIIFIQYIALRNSDGTYMGTIEVTQDITDFQTMDGERRLLDWD
jgi:uncharacterized protein